MAHQHPSTPTFNQVAFLLGAIMLLCIAIIGAAAFFPDQANSAAGKEALSLCDFGFKSGMGAVLGLIGGRATRLR